MSEPIKNRYEFVILFDVENGNPNGDPDAGNMPRVDPETGLGLVTDVCLKRKIRNYVETVKEDAAGYRIYVKDGVPLNRSDAEAYKALDVDEKTAKEKKKADPELDRKIRDWMCANFYDIRAFGAVMTTFMKAALNCGQVRGPVQLGFARSVEPVIPQEITITRVAITTEADAEKKGTEMGRKYIVPYGLYRCEGYISANLARKTTGFSEEDLSLLWEAILNMFENDHSAARGKMAVRELIVFRHDSELGSRLEAVRHGKDRPKGPGGRLPRPLLWRLHCLSGRVRAARRHHLYPHGVIDFSEDLLPLSGLQHFAFCRRQWALIHLEQQWQENLRTVEGGLLHRRAHDEAARERRSDTLILRGLQVVSHQLGLSGQCDVVEFHATPKGVPLQGDEGLWQPYPVEYKRGKPKSHQADELQLCAQAMCLEEMLCCSIPEGALFYGEPRRRTVVLFTPELRETVRRDSDEMHQLYHRGHTPKAKPSKSCSACSLKELCLPQLVRRESVQTYLRRAMEESP